MLSVHRQAISWDCIALTHTCRPSFYIHRIYLRTPSSTHRVDRTDHDAMPVLNERLLPIALLVSDLIQDDSLRIDVTILQLPLLVSEFGELCRICSRACRIDAHSPT